MPRPRSIAKPGPRLKECQSASRSGSIRSSILENALKRPSLLTLWEVTYNTAGAPFDSPFPTMTGVDSTAGSMLRRRNSARASHRSAPRPVLPLAPSKSGGRYGFINGHRPGSQTEPQISTSANSHSRPVAVIADFYARPSVPAKHGHSRRPKFERSVRALFDEPTEHKGGHLYSASTFCSGSPNQRNISGNVFRGSTLGCALRIRQFYSLPCPLMYEDTAMPAFDQPKQFRHAHLASLSDAPLGVAQTYRLYD